MEPIAIVGIGCRFPGARSRDGFWRLLERGVDAITQVPSRRFDATQLTSRWGGFIDDVESFDAEFFGIAPRDARHMDPQQRIALEVAWEALEDGRQDPSSLRGTPAAVFMGMIASDYEALARAEARDLDLSVALGTARAGLAGRLSHALGLVGPSVTLDSDRSSSLVAVHLACQSLRTGEASLAIAGGTNLVLSAEPSIALARAGLLAADGRCKFCDARADGFVRSDGVGIVVLKPLSAARRDGDRVYAVIRGSAVNHEGARGGGLTTPSAPGQAALVRAACAAAGVSPGDLAYVEAHGTGTVVGDPVEVEALATVVETERASGRQLRIGSVKTNIGHAEAAAGIAGLIKTALALERGVLPASLHFGTPNPRIRFDGVIVQRETGPWPEGARIAGVTSLGLIGTNAHAVLEAAPAAGQAPARPDRPPRTWRREIHWLSREDEAARPHASNVLEFLSQQVAHLLGIPAANVTGDSHVARLGFDSIMAVQLKHVVERDLGVGCPEGRILRDAPLRELAMHVSAARAVPRAVATHPERFPLSAGQEAIWSLHQLDESRAAYNVFFAVDVRPALDADALRRALLELTRRHPALRTTFRAIDGGLLQAVGEPQVDFALVDAARWTDSELDARLSEDAHRPFDLERGPILRARAYLRAGTSCTVLVVAHHIAIDHWSLRVLLPELITLCRAPEAALPAPHASYAEFVAEEGAARDCGAWTASLDFWEQHVPKEPAPLRLPFDYPRRASSRHKGAACNLHLGSATSAAVQRLAREEGTTPYVVTLAAWFALLHHFSADRDIVVGSPFSGRSREAFSGTVGYFVNVLPICASIAARDSLRALVRKLRTRILEAFEHQSVPLPRIVERVAPHRDTARTPLFDVLFVFHQATGDQGVLGALNVPGACCDISGFELTSRAVEPRTSKLDLNLTVTEHGDDLHAVLVYDTDVFSPATASALATGWVRLVERLSADADLPLERLSIFEAAPGATPASTDSHPPVVRAFAERARSEPSRLAAVSDAQELSYGELHRRSNRLARHLRRLGVGPESLVAVVLPRSIPFLATCLGVWKAGGAYVPFEHDAPLARVEQIVRDERVAVVVTTPDVAAKISTSAHVLASSDVDVAEPDSDLDEVSCPSNLAYVIFTSGSTGRPKGVAVEHRQLASFVARVAERFEMTPGATYAMVSTVAADLGHTMLFPPLATGGTVHLVSDDRALDGAALAQYLARNAIDYMKIAPSHFAALLETAPARALLPRKILNLAGEALRWSLAERLRGTRVFNAYGPTETTVSVLAHEVHDRDGASDFVPLGRGFGHCEALVLNDALERVAPGAVGEIFLAGSGVGRGYISDPAATAERFVPHPYPTRPGERLYRSGDLGRARADGTIEFLGRRDHQVKVRGHRVELAEVERGLRELDGVCEAVATVCAGASEDAELVGYIVLAPGHTFDARRLKSALRERMPRALVPSTLVPISTLPLNRNGKVDRAGLPRPPRASMGTAAAPATALERRLAAVWGRVLDREDVDVEAHFFDEMGGTSIALMRVHAEIVRTIDAAVRPTQLFQHPSIRSLARVLEGGHVEARARVDDWAERRRHALEMLRERKGGRLD